VSEFISRSMKCVPRRSARPRFLPRCSGRLPQQSSLVLLKNFLPPQYVAFNRSAPRSSLSSLVFPFPRWPAGILPEEPACIYVPVSCREALTPKKNPTPRSSSPLFLSLKRGSWQIRAVFGYGEFERRELLLSAEKVGL